MSQQTIIISGVNMLDSGILAIYQDCLKNLSNYIADKDIKVIALVGNKSLFDQQNIEFIEFKKSKNSWFYRIYYEYFYFKKISKKIKPDVWLSMHDTSPYVICKKQFVYCHNPNIFYNPSLNDWFSEPKVGIFHYLYDFVYRLNIKKNAAVFVQQNWIKEEFEKRFNLSTVLVVPPESKIPIISKSAIDLAPDKIHFFYPSFPRVFKNFECITEAILLLSPEVRKKIKVHLTIGKEENKYSKFISNKYNLPEINYLGTIDSATVNVFYQNVDCLLFPSKIETWGLPLTEAKSYGLPLLVSDLSYAKETVGDYDKVSFFNPENPADLARLMTAFIEQTIIFEGNKYPYSSTSQLNTWNELFDFILKEN